MEIHLRGRYHGFLSSVERAPCADVWMSSPNPAKTVMASLRLVENESLGVPSVVRSYWESVASQGAMRIVTAEFGAFVRLDWDRNQVPADTAVHVQVFVELDEKALGAGKLGLVPAGSAHVHLSELLDGEVVTPIIHQSLQDEPLYSNAADTQKGVLVVSIANPEVRARVKFLEAGALDIVQANSERIHSIMRTAIHTRSARATNMAGLEGLRLQNTLREMAGVRAEDYATPAGVVLLDEEFFTLSNVLPPVDEDVWMFMKRAAEVRGWTTRDLGTALIQAMQTPRPWTEKMYQAQEIFIHGLTMLATAIYYSSDYAVVHSGGTPSLTIVESFDDALRRGVADCEDFAKLISTIFLFLRDHSKDTDRWKARVRTFARAFVCVVTLRSVCSSALDHVTSGGDGRPISMTTPVRMDQVGAHMHVVLLPVHYFQSCASRGHADFPTVSAPVCAEVPSQSEHLMPLYCEGTGPMSPFLLGATAYLGEDGEAYQKMQIAADHILMHPNVSMLSRFMSSHIRAGTPPPDALRFLRHMRQISLRKMFPLDSPFDFYRMAGDGFIPGMGVGSFAEGGRKVSMRKFTYMYKQDDGYTRGVPALEEASASNRVAFMFFDDPGPEVDEITRRVRCHLPPTQQINFTTRPSWFATLANDIEEVFRRELGDAKGKFVDSISDSPVPDGTVVVLHRFARTESLTKGRVRSVATLVRMNQAIAEVSVETFVLGQGAVQTDFVFKVVVPTGMENSVLLD